MVRRFNALILLLFLAACSPLDPTEHIPDSEDPVTQETFGFSGEDRDPEVSADGEWLCYSSTFDSDRFELYRKRIGSTTPVRLLSAPNSNERFPRLHPGNPNMLAFSSDRHGEWDIFLIPDLSQSPPEWIRISDSGADDLHPSWSPDGSRLVYCSRRGSEEAPWTLTVVDLRAKTFHKLEQIEGFLPSWSPVPGDDRILFQRMRQRDNRFSTLWTIRFREGNATDLTSLFGGEHWAAIDPAWSPAGDAVVFASVAKNPDRARILNEPEDLWTISAEGSHPTRITSNPAADWLPVWSRGDRIFFVSRRSGSARIWSISARRREGRSDGKNPG